MNNATPWLDHYDVVVSGDSFTRPWSEEWWIDLLRTDYALNVLNLGMDGWGTLAEIHKLRNEPEAHQRCRGRILDLLRGSARADASGMVDDDGTAGDSQVAGG